MQLNIEIRNESNGRGFRELPGMDRKLPEWIDKRATGESLSPRVVIEDLERMRGDGKGRKGLNALMKDIKALRFQTAIAQPAVALPSSLSPLEPASPQSILTPDGPSDAEPALEPTPQLLPGPPTLVLPPSLQTLTSVGKKRRAKPVDPRRKPKKIKV